MHITSWTNMSVMFLQHLTCSWRINYFPRISAARVALFRSPAAVGLEVLILCSATSLIHRAFGQFSGAPVPQASVAPWKIVKEHYVVTPLSSTDMSTIARMSDMTRFRQTLAPLLKPRISGTPENTAVQAYISGILTQLGYAIELDSFTGFPPAPFSATNFTNIIATLDPSAARRLVLACHFDSKILPGVSFSGATDSSVPCAMLLDLAMTLNTALRNQKTSSQDLTLQFMFFDGEEAFIEWSATDSLYGSRHLAEKLAARPHHLSRDVSDLAGIDLFVLLDLIGGPSATFRNFFPESSNSFQRMAAIESTLASTGNIALFGRTQQYFPAGGVPQFFRVDDDHVPFFNHGVPILHLIPLPFPAVWHTKDDDEAHLDFAAIEDLNTILRVFVCEYLTCRL